MTFVDIFTWNDSEVRQPTSWFLLRLTSNTESFKLLVEVIKIINFSFIFSLIHLWQLQQGFRWKNDQGNISIEFKCAEERTPLLEILREPSFGLLFSKCCDSNNFNWLFNNGISASVPSNWLFLAFFWPFLILSP